MKNLASAFSLFDAIYCINLDTATERWETVQTEFARIGISERVIHFSAIASPDPGLGCYLSHRALMEMADTAGYQNILIFEDDIAFDLNQTDSFLASLEALQTTQWDIFYPGSTWFLEDFPAVFPRKKLLRIIGCRSNHATAYTRRAYKNILAHLPAEI